ncbi:MAG: TIGR03960 family B12-binding radical SAM protein [Planctomycetota bacterium]
MGMQVTDPEQIHRILQREVLANVQTPARYLGGEVNALRKDPSEVEVSFALLFPDLYEVGMSHVGCQILYGILNRLDWAAAERAYAPWPDMQEQMRARGIPLYALESFRPVRRFDVVGFSLQYELLYTNVLAMLDMAGIPMESAQREPDDPIVIAGGPGAAVPEPMADFVDLFFAGDGEESIVEFAELVRQAKAAGQSRDEIILEAARRVPGVYAPAHYEPSYHPDGTLAGIRPKREDLPGRIRAAKVRSLEDAFFPMDLIVPFVETVHDRISLEIMRGCTRGCRFCQAGMLRRPVRPRPIPQLVEQARRAYRKTGHAEIALASLSSSDYPGFAELLEAMNEFAEPRGIGLSLSSLRVDDQLSLLPGALARVRRSGLTVAPEAATDRLRRVINKDVTDQELMEGARAAFAEGWRLIKLYFMIGLPTETPEDVAAIVELCERVSNVRREVAGGRGNVNVSIAPFVPKPHTPFQWEPIASQDALKEARELILEKARLRSVRYKFHDPRCSLLEAALARGDRRVGRAIRRAYEAGAQFDAWTEHFSFERWQQAFEQAGLSMDFYAHRQLRTNEVLPWGHVDFGLRKEFLIEEREKAFRGETTPHCRTGECLHCGVCVPSDGA